MFLARPKLKWRDGIIAPGRFSSTFGRAVVHGNTAYFSYDNYMYSFTLSNEKWITLPNCKYSFFAMAIVNGKLTTIGGRSFNFEDTNDLLSLLPKNPPSWKAVLPPMPTRRKWPDAVTTESHLVVAGGIHQVVVEVLDLNTLQWSTASSKPEAPQISQLKLCGEYLYLVQGHTIVSCSIDDLLKSCKSTSRSDNKSVWTELCDIPVYVSSLAVWKKQVIVVGGKDNLDPTAAVYCYDRPTNSWREIGQLPSPRSAVVCAVLPNNEVMVVGGYDRGNVSHDVFIGW